MGTAVNAFHSIMMTVALIAYLVTQDARLALMGTLATHAPSFCIGQALNVNVSPVTLMMAPSLAKVLNNLVSLPPFVQDMLSLQNLSQL